MSQVQLSINVADLDAAVGFYSKLLGTPPAKLRPGYTNFAIGDPPLKLVLNSPGGGPGGTINHLGVEVDTTEEVSVAAERLAAAGLGPSLRPQARCCCALQDKAWVHDPGSVPWEFCVVLEHIEQP